MWKPLLQSGSEWKRLLQITYPKTLRVITNILCDAFYLIPSYLQKKLWYLSCNIHMRTWKQCSTFYPRPVISKEIILCAKDIIYRYRNSMLIAVFYLKYLQFMKWVCTTEINGAEGWWQRRRRRHHHHHLVWSSSYT